MRKRIVVLVSGSGSNLQAIMNDCSHHYINAEVVAVISNVPDVYALKRASLAGIPAITLCHKSFVTREQFDIALKNEIIKHQADLIILAGFMRILSADFVNAFAGKMLNIHPSLLPKYPGLHTHKKALENGDIVHGASVHLVTAELDGGPVVLQSQLEIDTNDNIASLQQRVATSEWIIYPLVVKWFCDEDLRFVASKQDSFQVALSDKAFKDVAKINSTSQINRSNTHNVDCKIIINKQQDISDEKETT